jgi:hypothetical protein
MTFKIQRAFRQVELNAPLVIPRPGGPCQPDLVGRDLERTQQKPVKRRAKVLAVFLVIALAVVVVGLLEIPSPSFPALSDPTALSLNVSLNPAMVAQNRTVAVVLSDTNLLPFVNRPSDPGTLKALNLSAGPCDGTYPMGIAVYQGRLDLGNVSAAKAIPIYDIYSVYFCPLMPYASPTFTFSPLQSVTSHVDLNGYWSRGETVHPGGGVSEGVLHPFIPGVYTVVAGDEWGNVKIVYFQVNGVSPQG